MSLPVKKDVPPCGINDPPSQKNVPNCQIMSPCQINFLRFWDRIITLGTFICKRVTSLCPFLTMCTGPKPCTHEQIKHPLFDLLVTDLEFEQIKSTYLLHVYGALRRIRSWVIETKQNIKRQIPWQKTLCDTPPMICVTKVFSKSVVVGVTKIYLGKVAGIVAFRLDFHHFLFIPSRSFAYTESNDFHNCLISDLDPRDFNFRDNLVSNRDYNIYERRSTAGCQVSRLPGEGGVIGGGGTSYGTGGGGGGTSGTGFGTGGILGGGKVKSFWRDVSRWDHWSQAFWA